MINALKKLGIKIKKNHQTYKITGCGGKFQNPKNLSLFLGNAGTATRFLTAMLSFSAKLPLAITGDKRMQERPIEDEISGLRQLGAEIFCQKNNQCPPLILKKNAVGGHCHIGGDKSSQYFSALLMAAPLGQKNTNIEVQGELVSKPYIDMTIEIMKNFAVHLKNHHYRSFEIKSPQLYQSGSYTVETDASSATYFGTIAALTGSKIAIKNINPSSKQADMAFFEVLKLMGCEVKKSPLKKEISVKGPKKLLPLKRINLNHMPDGAMTVAILCATAKGKSQLTGLSTLRIKETDRLDALKKEFKKIGCQSQITTDSILINGNPEALHGASIETYNDHRMAMCFGVLATKIPGIKIKNPQCVNKTYPDFWKDLKKIGIKVKLMNSKTQPESIKFFNQKSNSNIILIGMRGSGKSTIAELLSKEINRPFIDFDKEIEKVEKRKIAEIVEKNGWTYFRKIEQKICTKFSKVKNSIISCGGGLILDKKNVQNLRKSGIVILLTQNIKTLTKRIADGQNRPSLTTDKNFIEEIGVIWKERKKCYYECADLIIHNEDSNKTVKKILEFVKKKHF